MGQIIINWLVLFILPFLAGMVIRFLARKSSKGWLVTVAIAVVVALLVITTIGGHRNIEAFSFYMYHILCALIGSLIMGVALVIAKKLKKE